MTEIDGGNKMSAETIFSEVPPPNAVLMKVRELAGDGTLNNYRLYVVAVNELWPDLMLRSRDLFTQYTVTMFMEIAEREGFEITEYSFK